MIEPATSSNPAKLYPYQIAELRDRYGASVDDLIEQKIIVELKGEPYGTKTN